MLLQYLLVILVWVFIFPCTLILCLIWFEHIGIYHVLETRKTPKGEPLHTKFYLMLEYNLYLSIVTTFSIALTIKTSVDPHASIENIAILSITASLAVVLVQRILANPCARTTRWIYKNCKIISKQGVAKRCKVYILPFFYAFVGVAVLLFLLLYSYKILFNYDLGIIPTDLLYGDLLAMIVIYFLALIHVTLIGEIILYFFRPVSEIPYQSSE